MLQCIDKYLFYVVFMFKYIFLDLDQWEDVGLSALPYFDKLLSLFTKMSQGWEFFTSLEIDGSMVFSSTGLKVDTWDYVLDMSNFLNYTNRCRIISEALQHKINYTSNVSYTGEEHKHLADIAAIIREDQVFNESDIKSNVTSELVAENE